MIVRDALDATMFDEKLCPEPGKNIEKTLTAELPEHLIREPVEQEESGCACSEARGSRGSWAAALSGLLAAALLGARRRFL